MNRNLALKILTEVMGWDDTRSEYEYRWLDLMSRLKYDGYRDFQAGVRFIESLVNWLLQFKEEDRQSAYEFVREKLVYVSARELDRLVMNFYPETVQPYLLKVVSEAFDIPKYRVWANANARKELEILRRKTLFLGLSDGAHTDTFRRSNAGRISNEQVVVTPQLEKAKWEDLLRELRSDPIIAEPDARFSVIFLIDDFVASGTTLIREEAKSDVHPSGWSATVTDFFKSIFWKEPEPHANTEWRGKISKFFITLREAESQIKEPIVSEGWRLCVHHYLATHQAARGADNIVLRYDKALNQHIANGWHDRVEFSFGHIFPESLPIRLGGPNSFHDVLMSDDYYDPGVETDHNEKAGGANDIRAGYGDCCLPLVLEHNTPNNSAALLWAESERNGDSGFHQMRPLFRRRQRHS